MKKLCLGFLLLGAFVPIRADEELKNSDFDEGMLHWEGAGEPAAAASESANPLLSTDPQAKVGMLIKLDAHEWTKISQQFHPVPGRAVLKVVYRCSGNLAFSTDYEDYRNAPEVVGYNPSPGFSDEPGMWMALLSGHGNLKHFMIAPQSGTDVQTYQVEIKRIAGANNRLCLAFPPGIGTVTLLHVGLDSGPDNTTSPVP